MSFYFVYVLRDLSLGKLYIGYTSNLRRRLREHANGEIHTTKRGKYNLIYFEAYSNKAEALGREKFLKGGSGRKYINKQLAHFFDEDV